MINFKDHHPKVTNIILLNDPVKKQILLIPAFLMFSAVLLAQDMLGIPELKRRVSDFTGTLSSGEINSMEQKLAALEQAKGSQLAVLIIPTTGDETIEQYGIRVTDQWKLGREGVDDGVLFLVAMNDRKMRIEVGYGLEGAITDALSKRIITNVVTPEFRSGHYYSGIDRGVDVLISAINGEELPPAVRQNASGKPSGGGNWVILLLILGFVGSVIMKAILAKRIGKGKASGVVALVVFLLGWLLIGLVAGLFISVIILIFTNVPSSGGRRGGGGFWGGYGGYGGGGGFSGGGGFGGFSGGGGGFGGGGASGGW